MRTGNVIRKIIAASMLFFLVVLQATAASTCYSVQDYPAVHFLGLNEQGFPRVALVGESVDQDNMQAPVLEQTADGWVHTGDEECKSSWGCFTGKQKCQIPIPDIELTPADMTEFGGAGFTAPTIEQNVSDCVQEGDDVYFGIEFYEGEGVTGLGGIGKYNTRTREMEIRRLPALLETSVSNLAFDGDDLWISASSQYECSGRVPKVPLLRYNWEKARVYHSHSTPEICGFNVRDIRYENNHLYIASDIGFTSMEIIKSEDGGSRYHSWSDLKNWTPVKNDGITMQNQSCSVVYDEMLRSLPMGAKKQLIRTLLEFKPGYMTTRILEQEAMLEGLRKREKGDGGN